MWDRKSPHCSSHPPACPVLLAPDHPTVIMVRLPPTHVSRRPQHFAGQRLNLFDFWAICNLEKQNKKQKLATPSTDTKFGMKRGEVRFTGLRHFRGTWARGFGFDHGLWTKITEMRG